MVHSKKFYFLASLTTPLSPLPWLLTHHSLFPSPTPPSLVARPPGHRRPLPYLFPPYLLSNQKLTSQTLRYNFSTLNVSLCSSSSTLSALPSKSAPHTFHGAAPALALTKLPSSFLSFWWVGWNSNLIEIFVELYFGAGRGRSFDF